MSTDDQEWTNEIVNYYQSQGMAPGTYDNYNSKANADAYTSVFGHPPGSSGSGSSNSSSSNNPTSEPIFELDSYDQNWDTKFEVNTLFSEPALVAANQFLDDAQIHLQNAVNSLNDPAVFEHEMNKAQEALNKADIASNIFSLQRGLENALNSNKNGANTISEDGLKFIASHEGFSSKVYNDACGLATIGYGHLIKPGESFTEITKEEALNLLNDDIKIASNAVNKTINVSLNQNQFDALVSLAFNIGAGGFQKSSLAKSINNGETSKIENGFSVWNKGTVDGKLVVLDGLVNRRKDEYDLFNNGNYGL